ncbi:hypothetical protein [Herpetosiphon sp. NSE202]|uniref:hypothetical protein n=1 Tax=Herpetosiphon sp. NSE202 TaxID=3351349 RepID=UPI00363FA6EF
MRPKQWIAILGIGVISITGCMNSSENISSTIVPVIVLDTHDTTPIVTNRDDATFLTLIYDQNPDARNIAHQKIRLSNNRLVFIYTYILNGQTILGYSNGSILNGQWKIQNGAANVTTGIAFGAMTYMAFLPEGFFFFGSRIDPRVALIEVTFNTGERETITLENDFFWVLSKNQQTTSIKAIRYFDVNQIVIQ